MPAEDQTPAASSHGRSGIYTHCVHCLPQDGKSHGGVRKNGAKEIAAHVSQAVIMMAAMLSMAGAAKCFALRILISCEPRRTSDYTNSGRTGALSVLAASASHPFPRHLSCQSPLADVCRSVPRCNFNFCWFRCLLLTVRTDARCLIDICTWRNERSCVYDGSSVMSVVEEQRCRSMRCWMETLKPLSRTQLHLCWKCIGYAAEAPYRFSFFR